MTTVTSAVIPHKKALCVGISYKGQRGPHDASPENFELPGAHGDVERICGLLTGCYGYDERNITILQDLGNCQSPTRANILAAMEELVGSATPGGNLFFFFAGHGDQIINLDGTERDGMDEVILPLDWKCDATLSPYDRERYSVKILDDEMNNIFVNKLPPDCRLTALFDTCHSGTMMDLPYSRYYGPHQESSPVEISPVERSSVPMALRTSSPEPNRRRAPRPRRDTQVVSDDPADSSQSLAEPPHPEDVASINRAVGTGPLDLPFTLASAPTLHGRMGPHWGKETLVLRGESLDEATFPPASGAQVVSWSACSDAQNGLEYTKRITGKVESGGLMVKAFVDLLSEKRDRTYKDLLKSLSDSLRTACEKRNRGKAKKEWVMQEPQLGSHHKLDLNQYFEP